MRNSLHRLKSERGVSMIVLAVGISMITVTGAMYSLLKTQSVQARARQVTERAFADAANENALAVAGFVLGNKSMSYDEESKTWKLATSVDRKSPHVFKEVSRQINGNFARGFQVVACDPRTWSGPGTPNLREDPPLCDLIGSDVTIGAPVIEKVGDQEKIFVEIAVKTAMGKTVSRVRAKVGVNPIEDKPER